MIKQVVDEWGDVYIEIWQSAADSPLSPAPVTRFAVDSHVFENPVAQKFTSGKEFVSGGFFLKFKFLKKRFTYK